MTKKITYVKNHRLLMEKETKKLLKQAAALSSIGMAMVLAIFIGLAVGVFLDNKFSTKPVFTLVFLIFGIIAGYRNILVMIKRYSSDQD
ncbi:MAG: AtpZ/AtpI family protein [Thermodesulfobacteriota bacterium]|nr:AtpZ/AtpI family protein [Thermodesulfobacteriota bacterium]